MCPERNVDEPHGTTTTNCGQETKLVKHFLCDVHPQTSMICWNLIWQAHDAQANLILSYPES